MVCPERQRMGDFVLIGVTVIDRLDTGANVIDAKLGNMARNAKLTQASAASSPQIVKTPMGHFAKLFSQCADMGSPTPTLETALPKDIVAPVAARNCLNDIERHRRQCQGVCATILCSLGGNGHGACSKVNLRPFQ